MRTLAGRALRAVAGALFIYGALALMAWWDADRLIFRPPPATYGPGDLPVQRIPHPHGGTLALLHLPAPGASHTLLFSHGNGEDLGMIAPFLVELQTAGLSVLAYDYRGYGLSAGGPPTARRAEQDLLAAWQYATGPLGLAPPRLVLHGRSVGSGPSTWLATREDPAGLILESAFTSTYRVVSRWLWLPFERFPNQHRLASVRCPVFVIHGDRDAVIAPWHGRALRAVVRGPARHWWIPRAGHNDLFNVAGDAYARQLRDFLDSLADPSPEPG